MTEVIESVTDWQTLRNSSICQGQSIGFVPTMGALHAGHQSLLERCRSENAISVLSIFINPKQFDDPDDFQRYPKTLIDDLALAKRAKVDYVFLPKAEEMYADNFHYQITEQHLSHSLCGLQRPGHFTGVLTVVMKLLQLIQAQCSYFGEKDYQQYLLIKGMARAFFLTTEIIPCATIRDHDGLALSSRNKLLTSEQRQIAGQFAQLFHQENDINTLHTKLAQLGITIDYLEDWHGRRFVAVRIGKVRLIDNKSF